MNLYNSTSWDEETKWLIVPNIYEAFEPSRTCLIPREIIVTQKPQPKRMSFKEGREKIRELSRQGELRRKEYLKKRGELLSFLDYDDE